MATEESMTKGLDLRTGHPDGDDHLESVRAVNMGGESGNLGAPVMISSGLEIQDDYAREMALRQNPPMMTPVPAQDPTPHKAYTEGQVLVARLDEHPAQGGPGALRRVDDRTPDSALESAGRPYNADASVAQRAKLQGTDAAEETAEGKQTEEGAAQRVAEGAQAKVENRGAQVRKPGNGNGTK